MLTHEQIWMALDALAARHGMTPSALARRAGLDPTTFNKSKRHAGDRPRWPSTESIAKVLEATGTDATAFFAAEVLHDRLPAQRSVPLLGMTQAGMGGFFDSGGYPVGTGWDEIPFPTASDDMVFALEVTGDSMMPAYRDGDVLIVSRSASVRRNDRVVVRTNEGEVMAKVLHRITARTLELHSLNPEHPPRILPLAEVDWMARILWASQ
ncbi:helix-turn-helix transcriptional regulator [Pseudoxanthobacter sp.]|uniref:helix-turn-helix transcriptional regulator n=1 Tax=Pseudoxanthobacter sp. TaxID=1925742 RepID=UPI002FE0D9EC